MRKWKLESESWKLASSPEGENGKDDCVFDDGAEDAEDAGHNVPEKYLSWEIKHKNTF